MTTTTETHGFQAEVKQLLHLMIHSLYSNQEIFLRELISNASDAADKLRFEAVSDDSLYEDDPELRIRVAFDPEARTISISDNGIGMSREEVIDQLGTIAKSGTAELLQQMDGDQRKDAGLIGQFGVGFYSSFIVADRVTVLTRRAGLAASQGVQWESDGQGEFSIETIERAERGTTVILHLRDESSEFADDFRLRSLIRKYSDHIGFPVLMPAVVPPAAQDNDDEAAEKDTAPPADEVVNSATALWTRPRTEISDEEYQEFYKHIAHDFQDALLWSHNRVEGKREYTSLLYIPAKAPFDLWNRDVPRGLKLYVQRVFIMDDAEQFLPLYLRFVRGVIDSSDLSLNVSRELLQQDATVEAIKGAVTKRVLSMLEKLGKDKPEEYQGLWNEFGKVLKEGPAEDHAHKEKIASLMRFASTHLDDAAQNQSLVDYLGRKKEGQDQIYYITADSFQAAQSSPQLEIYRKKGIEVLLLSDSIDEWLVGHLNEFDGVPFRDVRRGELNLGGIEDQDKDKDKDEKKEVPEEHKDLIERLKKQLEADVEDVRITDRLTQSPACIVIGEYDMGLQMRRIMEASGQAIPESKPIFEINPEHALVQRMSGEKDEQRFGDLARVLFDQANLTEGQQLKNPGEFVQSLNRLLL